MRILRGDPGFTQNVVGAQREVFPPLLTEARVITGLYYDARRPPLTARLPFNVHFYSACGGPHDIFVNLQLVLRCTRALF